MLREQWTSLSDEQKLPFEKKARDHIAKQALMTECITDALRKEKGGNCQRSFASIAKVTMCVLRIAISSFTKPLHTQKGNRGLVQ